MSSDQIPYWTFWVYVAGLVVQVGGVIAVVYSITHIGKTFRKSAFDNAFSDLFELHKIFIEHPEMRSYFYDNKPLSETDTQIHRGRAIAEMFLDAFIHMYLQRGAFPRREKESFDAYLKSVCKGSGFLLDYLYKNREQIFPNELKVLVEEMHAVENPEVRSQRQA